MFYYNTLHFVFKINEFSGLRFHDILVIFNTSRHINFSNRSLEHSLILKFTQESKTNNVFNFLDVKLVVDELEQSIYLTSDNGLRTNDNSYFHDTYKKSIMKTIVFKSITYWSRFHLEITAINRYWSTTIFPCALLTMLSSAHLITICRHCLQDSITSKPCEKMENACNSLQKRQKAEINCIFPPCKTKFLLYSSSSDQC